MAGMGPAPKPSSERRRTNAPEFQWVLLPATGRNAPAPKLPAKAPGDQTWSKATRDWWARLWATPQATQWPDNDSSLFRLAALHERFWQGDATGAEMSEMRQIEDRHGLNPKALMQLRWRIVDEEVAEAAPLPPQSGRRERLKVVV